jgi:hypothetical protein
MYVKVAEESIRLFWLIAIEYLEIEMICRTLHRVGNGLFIKGWRILYVNSRYFGKGL